VKDDKTNRWMDRWDGWNKTHSAQSHTSMLISNLLKDFFMIVNTTLGSAQPVRTRRRITHCTCLAASDRHQKAGEPVDRPTHLRVGPHNGDGSRCRRLHRHCGQAQCKHLDGQLGRPKTQRAGDALQNAKLIDWHLHVCHYWDDDPMYGR
jgi:hypothetical protein